MKTRADVIEEALSWIGTPYKHQASLKGVGCDCLGLVRGVWRVIVGEEPEPMRPYSAWWAEKTRREQMRELADKYLVPIPAAPYRTGASPFRDGALLLIRPHPQGAAKHAAVMIAPDIIVHAYEGAREVAADQIPRSWREKIVTAYDYPGVV